MTIMIRVSNEDVKESDRVVQVQALNPDGVPYENAVTLSGGEDILTYIFEGKELHITEIARPLDKQGGEVTQPAP